jgi:hypothetical protein
MGKGPYQEGKYVYENDVQHHFIRDLHIKIARLKSKTKIMPNSNYNVEQ